MDNIINPSSLQNSSGHFILYVCWAVYNGIPNFTHGHFSELVQEVPLKTVSAKKEDKSNISAVGMVDKLC